MILLTGCAGFIGSNVLSYYNLKNEDVVGIDNLKNGRKIFNINDLRLYDYYDRDDIELALNKYNFDAVIHMGACSFTTEWDGQYLMKNNFQYSKRLYEFCKERSTPFVYASSASVYGDGSRGFVEDIAAELPINAYAYSKNLFDQYLHSISSTDEKVYGLRFFNVYGPREQHKNGMTSPVYNFWRQFKNSGEIQLFDGYGSFSAKQIARDFVFVSDCVDVIDYMVSSLAPSGVYNVGTGTSRSFFDVAVSVAKHFEKTNYLDKIRMVEFPEHLKGGYQPFTQADLCKLRGVGYDRNFISLENGVAEYLKFLEAR